MDSRLVLVVLGLLLVGVGGASFVVSADGDSRPVATELLAGTDPFDADTDGDGLDDDEEVEEYDTDPTEADTDGDSLDDGEEVGEYDTDPTDADTDGDDIDDGAEVETHGTDPTDADTDGDGLDDGAELNTYGTNATESDTDGDGLDDGTEIRDWETDPTESDSDGDGLEDGAEVGEYDTDPTDTDTDADGLDDWAEVEVHGTDPTDADTDGDGLEDAAELNTHGTNATVADTDGDGLDDREEVEDYDSDPVVADTDDDGLDDGAEVDEYGTNVTVADTDGDGLEDGPEVEVHGTNPTEADTDGDNLDDGAEVAGQTDGGVALPESDPLSKDLYVQYDYSRGTEFKSEEFREDNRQNWAEMPVSNPDGSEGIDLHIVRGGYVDGSPTFDDTSEFNSLKDAHYRSALGDRAGTYHQILFLPFDSSVNFDGYGDVPGKFNLVDTTARDSFQRNMVVHELLHNVVGDIESPNACDDDEHHYCEPGWLQSTVTNGQDEFLPKPIAEEIEQNGFEE